MREDEVAAKERRAVRETRRDARAEADRQRVAIRQRAQLEEARRRAAKAEATAQIIGGAMADLDKMLITIRPGPVLHVWRDGIEVVSVPLTTGQARGVMQDLLQQERLRE